MKLDNDKKIAQYLAELALTNPQQLPLVMLEIMKQRLMLEITNHLKEVVETSLSQFEEQLRGVLKNGNEEVDKLNKS